MLELVPARTALILVDYQNWQLGFPLAPHSAEVILANALALARTLKEKGGTVIRVRVEFAPGLADAPKGATDIGLILPPGGLTREIMALHPEVAAMPTDADIVKRHWSAFYGTDLDLQLRRRGIDTVLISGIATNFGVEQTARDAWHHNYSAITIEDASASVGADLHAFSIEKILPRVSRVRKTAEVIATLGAATS